MPVIRVNASGARSAMLRRVMVTRCDWDNASQTAPKLAARTARRPFLCPLRPRPHSRIESQTNTGQSYPRN
jgi:hypothetical protein